MNYYCVKQHDEMDCGAACLATICRQNGYKIGNAKIREMAGTDRQGTSVYGIIKAAEQLGFEAKGVRGKKGAFYSKIPQPCIAHMIIDGKMLHYVVVHKITKKKVIIADPAVGIVKLKTTEFFGEEKNNADAPHYQWSGVLILLTKKESFQKSDDIKGVYQRFFYLLIPQRKLLFHIFIASLVYTVLGVLGAFYFKELIDSVLPGGLRKTLTTLSIGIILLNAALVILNAFRTQLLLYLGQKLDIELLLGYYHHVMDLPMKFFSTRSVGEIISRFSDAGKVRDAISGAVLTVMIDSIMAIAGAIILYIQNQKLFAIAVCMLVLYMLIVTAFNHCYRKLNKEQMENNAQLTSYMVESLDGIETIKACNSEREIKWKAESKFVKLLHSVFKLAKINNIQSSLKILIELVGGVVILWVGSIDVINGDMSIGTLITFNSLLVYFLNPVKNLINLQPQMQTAVVAADRLGEILELEKEKKETEYKKMYPSNLRGDIVIHDVSFRYGTRKMVLDNINIAIKQGQKIAFVGESGSGKTTLSKLLLHMYSIEKGEILINNNNIEDIQLECIRDRIAYISQENFFFTGSIYENLVLGTDNINMDEVIEVCKQTQAHSFINEMPLRYDTILEENGANLSSGQKQRLAIARALLRKPDILICDEATSNLDVTTERMIQQVLNEYCENITTIFIAHRLHTIKNCDQIYVFEKGKVIESGTHKELVKHGGKYADMVWQQGLDIGIQEKNRRKCV